MNLESGAPDNLAPEPGVSPDAALESRAAALDRVRQIFVAASSTEGIKKSRAQPAEGDFKFDEADSSAHRLRAELLSGDSWEVFGGVSASGVKAPNILRSESKNGVRFEMETIDSECRSPEGATGRMVRQQILTRRRGDEVLTTEAIVSLCDEAGNAYELNRLLPTAVTLVPGNLGAGRRRGPDEGLFRFSEPDSGPEVGYGDLTTNQGFLSFLHEAAHAWQSRFHPTALDDYRHSNKAVGVGAELYLFAHLLDAADRAGGALPPQELMDVAWQRGKNVPEMIDHMRRYVEHFTPIAARMGVTVTLDKITVEDETLRERVDSYVWAERQAWSQAIRAYRILEVEGLLPQPGTDEDVLGRAHEALRSYQVGLDLLEIEAGRPFTRKA